jgi:hypothetical protein
MDMKRIIFSTKKVDKITKEMDDGFTPPRDQNPYMDGKIGLRKEKLTFSYTDEEMDEYIKCKMDVIYFANNFAKVKTEDGSYKIITLRDYQLEVLDMFQNPNNKFNILNASRQVGKCLSADSHITTYKGDIPLYKLYFSAKKNKKLIDYIKHIIYTLIYKLS